MAQPHALASTRTYTTLVPAAAAVSAAVVELGPAASVTSATLPSVEVKSSTSESDMVVGRQLVRLHAYLGDVELKMAVAVGQCEIGGWE